MALHQGECSRCKLFVTWQGKLALKHAWCPQCHTRLVRPYGPTLSTHTPRHEGQLTRRNA
jgi:hypothetical protein